jgi:hypothetical protein
MRSKKRKKKSDSFVGFAFKMLVYVLKNNVEDISWTKKDELFTIENGEKELVIGMCHVQDVKRDCRAHIFLSEVNQKFPCLAARTLLHELIHHLLTFGCYYRKTEPIILRFERLLWERLTRRQKDLFVKKLPPLTKYATPPPYPTPKPPPLPPPANPNSVIFPA